MSQIYFAYNKFKRRLILKHMFNTKSGTNTQSTHNPFHTYSSWNPPDPDNLSLQKYLADVYTDLSNLHNHRPNTDNLSEAEKLALKELDSNPDIVIKPADKGGKIVVLDRDAYINEAIRQLSNSKFYKKLTYNPIQTLILEISTFITYLRGQNLIDNDTFSFLHPNTNSRTPVSYMLPKIHKQNTPGRPIISGCGSPTANLSIYLDHYLKPIVQQIPSYIKNTTHFLRILKTTNGHIPSNSILESFDVTSLYTNIPHDEGISCCLTALKKFYHNTLPLPLRHIKTMLDFIMKKNYFLFDGNFYLQIHGTAMGTPCAPNYANIFMEDLETRIISTAPGGRTPILWKRYIDDIYVIWTHSLDQLHEFHAHMNRLHHSIQFEMDFSLKELPFLDTITYFNTTGSINTTLYTKPTDICSLLHAQSFHPASSKKGIIYSQAIRYRRIITQDEELDFHLENLFRSLVSKGYDPTLIHSVFSIVRTQSQTDLLKEKETPDEGILPFVIPFNTNTKSIGLILNKHWSTIMKDITLNPIHQEKPIMAFKRNRNIRDILVHTKL